MSRLFFGFMIILTLVSYKAVAQRGATRPASMVACNRDIVVARSNCNKPITQAQAKALCNFTGDFDRFADCAAQKATEKVQACVTELERVADICAQGHVDSDTLLEKAERESLGILINPADPNQATIATSIEDSIRLHTKDKQEAEKVMTEITKNYGKLEDEKKKFLADLEKLRPKDSEQPKSELEKLMERDGVLEKIAQAMMGTVPTPTPKPALVPVVALPSRFTGEVAASRLASLDKKSASDPGSLRVTDAPISDALPEYEKSKIGKLEQKQGMSGTVSAKAPVNSMVKSATASLDSGSGTAIPNVNQGSWGTAPSYRGKPYSVTQLQKRLQMAKKNPRTPAQLRFQAGITNPHSDIFLKIKFRYSRVASSLRP